MKLRESPSGFELKGNPGSTPSSLNVLVWNFTDRTWVIGNASVPMQWGAAVATAGQFLVPYLGNLNSLAAEAQSQYMMSRTGYLRAFSFQATTDTTVTLRINGIDTAVVINSTGAVTLLNDVVIRFSANDAISWRVSGPAGVACKVWCDILPRNSFTP